MIQKLENGVTLITLGQGTVYTGNVSVEGYENFGIYYSNSPRTENADPENAVIIQINDMKGVASYLMSLMRLLETWVGDDSVRQQIEDLKKSLEPLLPKGKE